jgi:acyl carrier protein
MNLEPTEIQETVIKLVEEMTEEWGLELDSPIAPADKLIENLDFSSVDFVQLFVSIEDKFQKKLGFHDLLMVDGKYIDDLSITELVMFIANKLNSSAGDSQEAIEAKFIATLPDSEKINASKVAQFREVIPSPPVHYEGMKNTRRVVFILCPSRSGSTLLRVILAGHPQLFAPPELHLLTYDTLKQRQHSLSDELNKHLLSGTVEAIMRAKDCSIGEAEQLMQTCVDQDLSSKQFYALLQEWIGDKLLVDKTPSYAYHPNILKRAETDFFAGAYYIHLLRHPFGMIRSFEDAKLDRLVPFMRSETFSRREYAEMAWLICQQNILEFLKDIPSNRQSQVKFEDLVANPQITAESICKFLGLDFYPEMLEPYKEKNQRMTDGVYAVSRMSGDLKFHLHERIEPEAAYRWQKYYNVDFLSDMTWQLAESFGYARP